MTTKEADQAYNEAHDKWRAAAAARAKCFKMLVELEREEIEAKAEYRRATNIWLDTLD